MIPSLIMIGLTGILARQKGFNPLPWLLAPPGLGLLVLFFFAPIRKEESQAQIQHRRGTALAVGVCLTICNALFFFTVYQPSCTAGTPYSQGARHPDRYR